MKTALVSASHESSVPSDTVTMESQTTPETHAAPPGASAVYDLEVLICRVGDGETRARAANLPLPESRCATVREALQTIIEAARQLIKASRAGDGAVPWIVPPALPEENESRFVVPLVV
jgi:hypothetical protein